MQSSCSCSPGPLLSSPARPGPTQPKCSSSVVVSRARGGWGRMDPALPGPEQGAEGEEDRAFLLHSLRAGMHPLPGHFYWGCPLNPELALASTPHSLLQSRVQDDPAGSLSPAHTVLKDGIFMRKQLLKGRLRAKRRRRKKKKSPAMPRDAGSVSQDVYCRSHLDPHPARRDL